MTRRRRLRLRHPSRRALQAWLDGDGQGIDAHVATCNQCATTLEELEAAAPAGLSEMLAAVYSTPADLHERLERQVAQRLDSLVILDVVTDLFGAGMETSRLLLTEEMPDE